MSKPLQKSTNPSPVLKKTYDFYKTIGNLWESRYLASEKVAKYYHVPHESYISGPNSPSNLSISHSKKLSEDYLQKAVIQVKQSKNRLNQRKTERVYIQSLSKQIQPGPCEGGQAIKPNPEPQVPKNSWENLKDIPNCRLKHVLPRDVIQKDLQGFNSILVKNQMENRQKQIFNDLKQVNKLKERLFTIQRHAYYTNLEQRSGIEKVRNNNIEQGVYGYIKAYKATPRIVSLSLPHKPHYNDTDKSDLQGMITKEYPAIVMKNEEKSSKNLESMSKKYTQKKDEREFIEETIQSISEFEKKLSLVNK